jgi:chromosome segregation ATPase
MSEVSERSAAGAARVLLAKIDDAMPEIEEFHNWKSQKAARLAELAAAKAKTERHRNARTQHDAAVEARKRELEQLESQLRDKQNELHRVRKEFDYWATEWKDLKRRNRAE